MISVAPERRHRTLSCSIGLRVNSSATAGASNHCTGCIMASAAYQQSAAPDRGKETIDPENTLFMRRSPRRLEGEAIRDSMLAVAGVLDRTMFGAGTQGRTQQAAQHLLHRQTQPTHELDGGVRRARAAGEPGRAPDDDRRSASALLMNGPHVREWADSLRAPHRSRYPRGDRSRRARLPRVHSGARPRSTTG